MTTINHVINRSVQVQTGPYWLYVRSGDDDYTCKIIN